MRHPNATQLTEIIRSGILAPSAENYHHAVFEPHTSGLKLWGDDVFQRMPRHRRLLTLSGFGAMAENMVLKADTLGFGTCVNWFPDPTSPTLVASFSWAEGGTTKDALASAIPLRHTNRKFYRREKLPLPHLQLFAEEVAHIEGVKLMWLNEGVRRALVLQLIRIAETERFRRQHLHQELFSAIRFDLGWKRTADEGLPPGALEVESPMRLPFTLIRHWKVMRALNLFGVHHLLGIRAAYLPCLLAPHLGLLASTLETEEAAVAVGRAFERVWLRATLLGLALQPMAASVALPLQESGHGWVAEEVKVRLKDGWARILGSEIRPFMLFRVGKAEPPSIVAQRKPVQAYLYGRNH